MPITIPNKLPAVETLQSENIFVMTRQRAIHQDIRPLKILILNLMPKKIETETQILRLLGNSPLQVEIELMRVDSYTAKNTSQEHLFAFYKTFDQINHNNYDGLIITGAPVEHMTFEDVSYWHELTKIMEWTKKHVFSVLYICWGAQAGLYHHYGVPKYPLDKKQFGVFKHTYNKQWNKLLRGFDDSFFAPHSRHTEIRRKDIEGINALDILSESEEAGVYIVATKDLRRVFVTGHSEYDRTTLKQEYDRDKERGQEIEVPCNYFPGNDPEQKPEMLWRGHANLLYVNWLNYAVYQETPYELEQISLSGD